MDAIMISLLLFLIVLVFNQQLYMPQPRFVPIPVQIKRVQRTR